MSYNQRNPLAQDPPSQGGEARERSRIASSSGPMTRRSPSILVTDSRTSKNRVHAPFAGHAASSESRGLTNTQVQLRKQNIAQGLGSGGYGSMRRMGSGGNNANHYTNNAFAGGRMDNQGRNTFAKSRVNRRESQGQFSEITLDNILAQSSDIPSGRREQRRSSSSSSSAAMDRFTNYERLRVSSNYRKMINPLPTRKSKISQKLVLIPEEQSMRDNILFNSKGKNSPRNSTVVHPHNKPQNVTMDKYRYRNKQRQTLPRLTAYNIADAFNLKVMSKFLRETHEVSPRLYDDCLYVPYVLPLLPGKDGFRIKSNLSKKTVGGKTLIDKLIDHSERRDHHYEYYSGVETVEDMNNNYELETNAAPQENAKDPGVVIPDHLPAPTSTNPDAFDPSEPQFFSEDRGSTSESPSTDAPLTNSSRNGDARQQPQENRDTSNNHDFSPHAVPMTNSDSHGSNSSMIDQAEKKHAEIFMFHYGVVVFWNFTEAQEKNILGDLTFADNKNMIHRPLDEQDIEIEEFHFEYDMETERPRIFNDVLTLRSGDHIIKLTLSYAIAQSSKLSRFESRISPILTSVTRLPKRLALYGSLGLRREQLLKKSGKLFKLRVDVNLSSNILDTPDFFWSVEPSLHPLYVAMREYLEIDKRVQVVNDRCKVFLEFFDICVDSVAERNMARVTWWFIIVILLGVLFSLSEILVRYNIIHNLPGK